MSKFSIDYIMIHHTAVPQTKNKNQWRATNAYHKALWEIKSSLGYYGGYTYEISAKGKLKQFRKEGERTIACYQQDMNSGKCIHIALDGNFDIEKPTPAQIFKLRDLLRYIHGRHNNIKKIFAHNEFANKSCPGANIDMQFIRSLMGGVKPTENTKKTDKEKSLGLLDDLKALIVKIYETN